MMLVRPATETVMEAMMMNRVTMAERVTARMMGQMLVQAWNSPFQAAFINKCVTSGCNKACLEMMIPAGFLYGQHDRSGYFVLGF